MAAELCYTIGHDPIVSDNRIRNSYEGGDLCLPPVGSPSAQCVCPAYYTDTGATEQDHYDVSTSTGVVAWAALALFSHLEITGNTQSLGNARRLADWMIAAVSLFVWWPADFRYFAPFPASAPRSLKRSTALAPGFCPGRLAWRRLAMAPDFCVDLYRHRCSTWAIKSLAGIIVRCFSLLATYGGVWPMVHYYFFFGPKPVAHEVYNPLQKLAYTSALGLGFLSVRPELRSGSRCSFPGWHG